MRRMKKMKKMTGVLAALTAVIMLLAACASAGAEQAAPRRVDSAADADEWIAAFLGEHPEEMDGVWAMTAQMQMAAIRAGGIAGLAKQLSALGAVREIGSAYEGEIQGYKAFNIPCVFSLMSADLILIVQDGAIAGLSTGVYSGGREETAASGAFETVDLALPVPSLNGELPGKLTYPAGEGPFPAVVLVHGSGSSDMDETSVAVKPFRDLAEGLAEKGVAVYRFDKRTYVYGARMMEDHGITLVDESIRDAVNAVQLLSGQEKIDPERIFVLGHSLGGNAIPAIAAELEKAPVKARGFIMMAASPRPLETLIREQYDFLYSLMPEITDEQRAEKDALFKELDRLKEPEALNEDDVIMGVYAPYWLWLADYDALKTAGEIALPVLLLQGEEDYQVTMEDFAIWKDAFGEKENWRLISYPGLTHPFTAGLKSEGSAIYNRADQMDASVIADIADFILENGKDR